MLNFLLVAVADVIVFLAAGAQVDDVDGVADADFCDAFGVA